MTSGTPFGGARRRPPPSDNVTISCRATNPLSLDADLNKVFIDEQQARATTATRLFRNEELFTSLRRQVFPRFLETGRGQLDIWSSGCSSGEEVYSLAMVALDEFAKARRTAALRLFGTDINAQRLQEGCDGRYGRPTKDAFGPEYWRLLNQYADVRPGEVVMGDVVKRHMGFKRFDMRKRPTKHTFNYIVCNHVLQYYDFPGQLHILDNLMAVLKPGGYLYLEGITNEAREGARLERVTGRQNLYVPPGGRA